MPAPRPTPFRSQRPRPCPVEKTQAFWARDLCVVMAILVPLLVSGSGVRAQQGSVTDTVDPQPPSSAVPSSAVPSSAVPSSVALPELNANSEAEAFFKEGNRLFARAMTRQGQARHALLAQALERYARSLRIVRSRNAVYNTAIALVEADKPTEAFGYFHEYLRAEGLNDAERADVLRRLNALSTRVATVEVRSVPAQAEVRVDRLDHAPRGGTPLTLALTPGEHRLHVNKKGFADQSISLSLQAGETLVVERTLTPLPIAVALALSDGARALAAEETLSIDGTTIELGRSVPLLPGTHQVEVSGEVVHRFTLEAGGPERRITFTPPPIKTGTVFVTSDIAVTVSSAGALLGTGTALRLDLPEGEHELSITAHGFAPLNVHVETAAKSAVSVHAQMVPLTPPKRFSDLPAYGLYAAGGLGALGLATGIYALVIHDEYRAQPTKKKADTLDQVNLAADVFFGASLIAGGTALVLYLLEGDDGPRHSTAIKRRTPLSSDASSLQTLRPSRLQTGPLLGEGRLRGWTLAFEWPLQVVSP